MSFLEIFIQTTTAKILDKNITSRIHTIIRVWQNNYIYFLLFTPMSPTRNVVDKNNNLQYTK